MEVHQVKPEYTKIVAAIPHSVSDVSIDSIVADLRLTSLVRCERMLAGYFFAR